MPTDNLLTTILNDGRVVLGKRYKGTICACTYANKTQARRKVEQLGPDWAVAASLCPPYYVVLLRATIHKSITGWKVRHKGQILLDGESYAVASQVEVSLNGSGYPGTECEDVADSIRRAE